MSQSHAQALLAAFGDKLGLPQLGFDEQGFCSLQHGDIILNLEHQPSVDALVCYIWIGEVAEERRAGIAIQIADANYLLAGTAGAALGMQASTGEVMLTAYFSCYGLGLADLEKALLNLIVLADDWRSRLSGQPAARASEPHLGFQAMRV